MAEFGGKLPAQGGGAICTILKALEVDAVNWTLTNLPGRLEATKDGRPLFIGRIFLRESAAGIADRLNRRGRSVNEAVYGIEAALRGGRVCPEFVTAGGSINYEVFAGAAGYDSITMRDDPFFGACDPGCSLDPAISLLAVVRIDACGAT